MDSVPSQLNLETLGLSSELARFSLPDGVNRRLKFLLDKQDRTGEALTGDELAEAEGLVEVADFLSLLKLSAR